MIAPLLLLIGTADAARQRTRDDDPAEEHFTPTPIFRGIAFQVTIWPLIQNLNTTASAVGNPSRGAQNLPQNQPASANRRSKGTGPENNIRSVEVDRYDKLRAPAFPQANYPRAFPIPQEHRQPTGPVLQQMECVAIQGNTHRCPEARRGVDPLRRSGLAQFPQTTVLRIGDIDSAVT